MANGPVIGDADRTALEQFGVDPSLATDLITVENVPRTHTRTSHGFSMRVSGGRIIGALSGVAHTTSRNIEEEWEIERSAVGTAPRDLVPQNIIQRQLQVNRFDLFVRNMEEVMNTTGELVTLADQFRPFSLRTTWQSPVGIVLGGRRVYEYTGCWFSDMGRAIRSDDDRIVSVDATITYQLRRRVV